MRFRRLAAQHHQRRLAPRLLLAALLLLFSAFPALAQTFQFNLPNGVAATQLAAWSKITGIRVELGPGIPAALLNFTNTNAIKGPMRPYQALNQLLARTPIIILAEKLDVVTLGAVSNSSSTLLDSQPLPSQIPAELARQEALRRTLAFAFAPNVIARLVAVPSLAAPYAVGLKLEQGRYGVVALQPLEAGGAPRPCETAIDPALGRRLAEAWRQVVAKNVPRRARGLEGTNYTFAFRQGGGERQRELWEPAPATAEGLLVRLSQTMQAHCAAPSAATEAALATHIARLEQALRRPAGQAA